MNCNAPTVAVRRPGVNLDTGHGYKPFQFTAYQSDDQFISSFEFWSRQAELFRNDYEVLILPCNKCLLCLQARKRSWACRCINEAQTAGGGMFLTLTCSDDSIARTFPGGSLDHRPWQLFAKRLRKRLDTYCVRTGDGDYPLRFFQCGEYGEHSFRPHYHALIFGWTFRDPRWVGRSKSGCDIYTSPWLDELRYDGDGNEIFGPVSNYSAISPYDISYTCGYVEKKLGRDRPQMYNELGLNPEYVCMSRRPGIGQRWLERYHGDVWQFYQDLVLRDAVVATPGYSCAVPRYYFDRAKVDGLLSPEKCDIIKAHRESRRLAVSSDPDAMLESLQRAHCREYRLNQYSKTIQAPRNL